MTKIIYRYLVKKFIFPFLLTFFLALLIILMQFVWKYVDDLVGKGLEWYLILKLLFYASGTFVSLALALAILLSSLMTFGNLGEKYEIVALKSAGISIVSLMKPLAVIALLLSLFSFWFSDNVVPDAYIKLRTLLAEIVEQKPTLRMEEGVFNDLIDDYAIFIGKKHRDNENIEDILIYDHSKQMGCVVGTRAKRGTMAVTPDQKYFLFTLYDGYLWDESRSQNSGNNSKYPYFFTRFDKQYLMLDISSFEMKSFDESFFRTNSKSVKTNEINKLIAEKKSNYAQYVATPFTRLETPFYKDCLAEINANSAVSAGQEKPQVSASDSSMKTSENKAFTFASKAIMAKDSFQLNKLPYDWQSQIYTRADAKAHNLLGSLNPARASMMMMEKEIRECEVEWHQRIVLSLACFLFFFIGAPLGTIIRKGGIGIPLVITVIFFAFYFVISIFGEKMAKSGNVPVWFGMWFSTFITAPICVFLTYKAAVDSAVMSPDAYSNIIRKIKLLPQKLRRHTKK